MRGRGRHDRGGDVAGRQHNHAANPRGGNGIRHETPGDGRGGAGTTRAGGEAVKYAGRQRQQ